MLSEEKIKKLDEYFAGLIGGARENITVSKVARVIDVTSDVSKQVLDKLVEEGLLGISYAIRCQECGTLIKRIEDLSEIPDGIFTCYSCGKEIEVAAEDIEVLFRCM